MSVDRTWYTGLVDDDGSNSVGTVWNKAAVDSLLDAVDILAETVIGRTDTGTVNDWAPAGMLGHTFIAWQGATDAAFTGLAGGLTGQRVTIKNTSATKIATFAHNGGGSTAGNRFANLVTSAPLPIGPAGFVTYSYDGTFWNQLAHEQGAWITPAFSAGNFTPGGSWTVDAGDVAAYTYRVAGKTLTVSWWIQTSTVASAPSALKIAVPGGFTAVGPSLHGAVHDDAGAGNAGTFALLLSAGATTIDIYKNYGSGTFSNATNTTRVFGTVSFEVN